MEERIYTLEADYSAFITEVSGTLDEHTRLLRTTSREMSELKARATLTEIRVGNIEEHMKEMQSDISQMRGDVKQTQIDVKQMQGDISQMQGDIKQILTLLTQGKAE